MACLCLPVSLQPDRPTKSLNSDFLCPTPLWAPNATTSRVCYNTRNTKRLSIITAPPCASMKIIRSPSLDKHVEKHKQVRFVQKLKTLLLSKPKHYMPLHILAKCRAYLALEKGRSLRTMIHRYPTIFEYFEIPTPPTPLNATKSYSQLCVRLTPAAAALATEESKLKHAVSKTLAIKLQKLLMLSTHRRILLSKLVHIGPDLGLPPNFRSRLCSVHPDKFKTVDTSYGRALELVTWDSDVASPLPMPGVKTLGLIVDRPLKFKHLRLRKGLNVKRRHRDFLIKFGELPDVCPYKTSPEEFARESILAEKRACAVVREVLGMMVEKRTLVDHLTHFRKDFGLPNRLHAMLARHPELFYVSLKGHRDSVFLVEAYGDKGELLEKDETLLFKNQLLELVQEGKRARRAMRRRYLKSNEGTRDEFINNDGGKSDSEDDDRIDGFEDLLTCEDFLVEDGSDDDVDENVEEGRDFWTAEATSLLDSESGNAW